MRPGKAGKASRARHRRFEVLVKDEAFIQGTMRGYRRVVSMNVYNEKICILKRSLWWQYGKPIRKASECKRV